MLYSKDIKNLCNKLLTKFSIELLSIAAEKQLAMSTIAVANINDDERTQLVTIMIKLINERTIKAGFTLKELGQALRGIHLSGESLSHLAIIQEPITKKAISTGESLLSGIMYPCEQKPEKLSKELIYKSNLGFTP